ncbi:MAG: hypothetical protein HEP71_20110 [Roseivirga sp.]|nr:hypothetical protein [Roseivirga sp.]
MMSLKRIIIFLLSVFGTSSAVQGQNMAVDVFLPDLVSTNIIEYYTAFTPDGNKLYFVRRNAEWGDFSDKTPGHIYTTEYIAGKWQRPQMASFSGEYSDGAPFISGDGKYFFFTSKRPREDKRTEDTDIWFMTQTSSGWSTPEPLSGTINSKKTEFSPVLTDSGNLYFASMREGGLGQGDIYVCKFDGMRCNQTQNLGGQINSPTGEWNVFVDRAETYMIFEASGRISGKDNGDFYISFRQNGIWQKAIYMDVLNTEGSDLAARLSPDGKTLYFAQSTRGEVDIKSVSIEVIEQYRNK